MASLRNSRDRYGLIARMFHGAMLLTLGANLALGFLFDDAVETGEGRFAALHATLGILTLALLVGRVAWRFIDPLPPLAVGTPIERTIAHAGHFGLYALMLLVSMSGWFAASAECERIDLLGGMTLPALSATAPAAFPDAAPDAGACTAEGGSVPALREEHDDDDEDGMEREGGEGDELWEEVHEWSSWALLLLVLAHAAAALMHRRRKDGTWERMFG